MIVAEFKLTGNKELDQKFQNLPPKVQKKVLRPALRAAAKLVRDAAAALAPSRSGFLAQSLTVRAAKRSRTLDGIVTLRVITGKDFFKGEGFYGAFQEFGWRAGPRRLGDARKKIEGKHFIERASKAQESAVLQLATRLIAEGIEREAATSGN